MQYTDVDKAVKQGVVPACDLAFRPAEPADMEAVGRLFREAIAAMNRQGIDQWDDLYPTLEHLDADRKERSLWLVEDKSRLAASVTLNECPAEEYTGIRWIKSGRVLYVHRLCVDPDQQGRGVARKIMLWVERFAEERGYDVIRLDTFSGNPRALRLYVGLGYEFVADMTSRKGIFPCFEKEVTPRSAPGR